MLTASVSNVDLFRAWRESADLDSEWLLRRLRGDERQSEAMKVGEAFHKGLENMSGEPGEICNFKSDGYEFVFTCDCECALPKIRELRIDKQYGDLLVRGRIDGLHGVEVTDYKTTAQFDPERLMEGYQWRFYLDMLASDEFIWKVFVLAEDAGYYRVTQFHELSQRRYPDMEADCKKLVNEFYEFVTNPNIARQLVKTNG